MYAQHTCISHFIDKRFIDKQFNNQRLTKEVSDLFGPDGDPSTSMAIKRQATFVARAMVSCA